MTEARSTPANDGFVEFTPTSSLSSSTASSRSASIRAWSRSIMSPRAGLSPRAGQAESLSRGLAARACSNLFRPPALERARRGEGNLQRVARLLGRPLLRLAPLLEALDEVLDLRPPRVRRLDVDRPRLAAGRIEPEAARRRHRADVAAVLRGRGRERVLG